MTHSEHFTICEVRHPDYLLYSNEWEEWRDTYHGGEYYLDRYLKKFSDRETETEFQARKDCTPIPSFAKAAIIDVRNSIFQRLEDVTRIGGSKKYSRATHGEGAGVDRQGASMNSFIGITVLTELLVMGRCGVYVDAPDIEAVTRADEQNLSPYLYYYPIEDILSWELDEHAEDGTFKAVLLKDHTLSYSQEVGGIKLPKGRETRFRLVWKDDEGDVWCRFYNLNFEPIVTEKSDPTGAIKLGVKVVPFIMPDIGGSLLKEAASYQKALLNLASGDVNWLLKANTPFLVIQEEMRTAGSHLRKAAESATPGSQPAATKEERIGGTGRYYDVGMDPPSYIAPPTGPAQLSKEYQEKLEDDIRKLINLAVTNKAGSRTESAEAKKLSSQGLEAGLSFIGTVLKELEQGIARLWGMYENSKSPKIATVSYPARYILKTDIEKIEEAKGLLDLIDDIPSKRAKKTIAKRIVILIMGGKVSVDEVDAILAEIDSAGYTTSNIDKILRAKEAGLVGDELASEALGYQKGQVEEAREDRAEFIALTLEAQTPADQQPGASGVKNPASRGAPELDTNPDSGSDEKQEDEVDV